jgi:ADP-ribose pyrophosphatase YjhB (NUDIX family)
MTTKFQTIHRHQQEILKLLTTTTGLAFSQFSIPFVDSEQLAYHLKQLIEKKYIEKKDDLYQLTYLGKDYTNLTEDDIKTLEKQPKVGVLLRIIRINSETQLVEELVCKRLRQPYYEKVGRLTGKIRFGESAHETARRELKEETGLEAGFVELEGVHRKVRISKEGETVQDVIFFQFLVKELSGELVTSIGIQENFWLAQGDTNHDFYDDYTPNFNPEFSTVTFYESREVKSGF